MSNLNVTSALTAEKLPQVSIGMPVYNGATFIREALDSLLAQSFSDFELIISDNASTDGTEIICREYAEKDERIRYVRQAENLGPTANFKFVLDEAVGEYFMWAAHDDRRGKDFLYYTTKILDDDLNVGLVFSDFNTINLINNEVVSKFSVGYISPSSKKSRKFIFRLTNMCSSLIYGLHRSSEIKKCFIGRVFDFLDVHITHWYELNSAIKIVPLTLYSVGINGYRKPYSLEGSESMKYKKYLLAEWKLLKNNFKNYQAVILIMVDFFVIYRIVNAINNK